MMPENIYNPFEKIILVGGCPRSGTTLLGKEISKKTDALFIPEAQFKWQLFAFFLKEEKIETVIDALLKNPRFAIWGLDEIKLKNLNFDDNWTPHSLFSCICRLYQDKIGQSEASFVVDHTPENIQYYHAIRKHFPKVSIVHIIRDPRAVYNSVKNLYWGPNEVKSFYTWWLKNISCGLLFENKYPKEVQTISYENIVSETQESITKLLKLMSIKESINKLDTPIIIPQYTIKQHNLLSQQPQIDRTEGWKYELDTWESSYIESKLGVYMEEFGYERTSTSGFKMKFNHDLIILYRRYMIGTIRKSKQRQRLARVINQN